MEICKEVLEPITDAATGNAEDPFITVLELAFDLVGDLGRECPHFWQDLTALGRALADHAKKHRNLQRHARILDNVGYEGQAIQEATNVPTEFADWASAGADAYEKALGQVEDELAPEELAEVLEPIVWCYRRAGCSRRAGDYGSALHWVGRLIGMLEQCSDDQFRMRREVLSESYRDRAQLLFWMKQRQECTDPEEDLDAVGSLRHAADLRCRAWPESWYARWLCNLAATIEQGGDPQWTMGTDERNGDAVLIHNALDAAAADVIHQALRDQAGFDCVRTGPSDPRSVAEIADSYRAVVIMGSTAAPRMERFSHLFLGEEDLWKLSLHSVDKLRGKRPDYGYWQKEMHDTDWYIVAGITRIGTIWAAGKFARLIREGKVPFG